MTSGAHCHSASTNHERLPHHFSTTPTPPALSTSAPEPAPTRRRRLTPVRTSAQRRPSGRRRRASTPFFLPPPLRHSATQPLNHSTTRPLDHSPIRPLAPVPTSSFNPDPATSDAILQSIAADYSLSLTDFAAQHNTTIEALTAWLTREDIDERLSAIESACARRARLTAANHLPAVAHVAKQALEEASDVLRLPPDYRTQHSIALRIRATESARKAAALLLRIANFTPGPRRVRHHAAPMSPRVTPLSATSTATPTESSQGVPTAATPADRAQSAPCVGQLSETTTPCVAAPQAPIAATPTASAPTTSPSAPLTVSAQLAPNSLHTAESTPSEPISATSAARTTRARRAPAATIDQRLWPGRTAASTDWALQALIPGFFAPTQDENPAMAPALQAAPHPESVRCTIPAAIGSIPHVVRVLRHLAGRLDPYRRATGCSTSRGTTPARSRACHRGRAGWAAAAQPLCADHPWHATRLDRDAHQKAERAQNARRWPRTATALRSGACIPNTRSLRSERRDQPRVAK